MSYDDAHGYPFVPGMTVKVPSPARSKAFLTGQTFARGMAPGFPAAATLSEVGGRAVLNTPRSKVSFNVGGAKEHSGAAYGVRTSSSVLAPNVPIYGKEDVRGSTSVRKLQSGRKPLPERQLPVDMSLGAAGDEPNQAYGAMSRGYHQNPPEDLYRPAGSGLGWDAKPLFDDTNIDMPYTAPTQMGNGPKKPRRI